jgi:NADPH-dependent curcumin reductase CurA
VTIYTAFLVSYTRLGPTYFYLMHVTGFVEYSIQSDPSKFRVLPELGIPWSVYVGAAGMPGETALYAWKVTTTLRLNHATL